MNRLFLLVLLTVASICAASYDPYVPPFLTPSDVATSARLDAFGNTKITPQGATSVNVESWTVTSSPSSWTMSASATDIGLWNLATSTIWLSFNSGGATVSQGIPLLASGTLFRDAASGLVVWAVASTPQTITRAEGRR